MQPQPLKVMVAVGARPNYMKAAPLIRALTDPSTAMETGRPPIELTVTHTGQHYEDGLSRTLFEELSLPAADVNLNVGSGPYGRQTGLILQRFEPVLEERWPDVLVVAGDVNSTLACALVAAKSWRRLPGGGWKRPRIAHIEAGLRSFDPTMPEETNRRLTDALSDDLLIHSPEARGNLLREGVREDDILEVGNLMIDTLDRLLPLARRSDIFVRLGLRLGGAPEEGKPYALLTLHRPSNVDDPEIFKRLLRGAARISPDLEIIFPMHPRVRKAAPKILEALHRERAGPLAPIRLIEPLGYLDFIALMDRAALVLTDSGGVQEETTALGVPCLTLRENTERPVTVTMGTNTLAGIEEERIVQEGRRSLSGDSMPFSRLPCGTDTPESARPISWFNGRFRAPLSATARRGGGGGRFSRRNSSPCRSDLRFSPEQAPDRQGVPTRAAFGTGKG